MIFLYIYAIVAIIDIVLMVLSSISIAEKFTAKYPGLEIPKTSTASKLLSYLRYILGSFTPILNLVMCGIYVFGYDEFEENVMRDMYLKCMKEKHKEGEEC